MLTVNYLHRFVVDNKYDSNNLAGIKSGCIFIYLVSWEVKCFLNVV